jgi:hypothetical protein
VRAASANGVPASATGAASGRERPPSGNQPSGAGSARTSHSALGTIPISHTAARIGVPSARPRASSSHLAAGVSSTPPADNPVEATDSATERRVWNQRVTTVVAGTSPVQAKLTPNATYTTYSCQRASTRPSSSSDVAPSTPPATST